MKRRYQEVQTALPLSGESTTFQPLSTQVGGQHYKSMAIQPVEFCELNQLPYCMANVVKYVVRHRAKNGREDLEKAIHYCELGLSMYEKTKAAWRTNCPDWVITPATFCKENGFDKSTAKAITLLCGVFTSGMQSYNRTKVLLEKTLREEYAPRRSR